MKKTAVTAVLCMLVYCYAGAQVVINEVYGGGGNSGASLRNDFVELYNKGNTPVNLSGWSVQYNSAGANATSTWSVTNLSGTIQPNGYYLIQLAQGAGGTTNLPTPDATGTLALSATAGRVALVNNGTALVGCPAASQYVDLVGYGNTSTCFEGTGPAPATANNNTSLQRKQTSGVPDDTNNNSADFASGTPSPQASGAAASNSVVSITGQSDAAEPATAGRFTISFNPATTTTSTLNYEFGGNASFGTDYTADFSSGTPTTAASSGILEIPAGTSTITVTVTPVDDNLVESWDTVRLALSSPTNFLYIQPKQCLHWFGR